MTYLRDKAVQDAGDMMRAGKTQESLRKSWQTTRLGEGCKHLGKFPNNSVICFEGSPKYASNVYASLRIFTQNLQHMFLKGMRVKGRLEFFFFRYSSIFEITGVPQGSSPKKKNIATGKTSPAITPYHTYHFSISNSLTFITSKLPSQDDFHHLITFTTDKFHRKITFITR